MTARPDRMARPGLTADGGHRYWPTPPGWAGQAITGWDVRAALAALSAEHRQVIMEIYYHNRPVSETADLLRIPVSTVASRAYSAIRQLRRTLLGAC
jgi:RNA polymerase sigma-70 factor, ECF subfamily